MLSELLEKHQRWKDRRFLKKHCCETWEQYHRRFDPDYNVSASRVKDYYCGYPYWHVIERYDHHGYRQMSDYGPGGCRYGYHDIDDWCKEKLKDKYRIDILRVFRAPSTADQWVINEMGGGDHIFVAFKNERDYTWFMLRWS